MKNLDLSRTYKREGVDIIFNKVKAEMHATPLPWATAWRCIQIAIPVKPCAAASGMITSILFRQKKCLVNTKTHIPTQKLLK